MISRTSDQIYVRKTNRAPPMRKTPRLNGTQTMYPSQVLLAPQSTTSNNTHHRTHFETADESLEIRN